MAIYHMEAKVVSRGAGRSAVAASAYLSCSRLYNDYDGIQHDYTKKRGLVWQEVFLPKCAPQEWQDREKLWNAVEEVETAKDSRLAREFVVALPIELNREEQIALLQEFIREQFVSDGMCADAAIHDTDGHNPHAHILLTVRPLDEQGKWQYKTEKEYLCMRNGEERGFTAAEFKAAQDEGWEKQYPYNLVFCSSNGRPMESQVINRAFNKLIKENGLPHVVFHSLRHSSITYKLKLNGGDMKSVQGDSGHAQVKMVADVYSHIIDEDRCINAQRLEEAFYSSKTPDPVEDTEPKTADTAVTESDESDAAKILELLKNPETAALLKQLAKAL